MQAYFCKNCKKDWIYKSNKEGYISNSNEKLQNEGVCPHCLKDLTYGWKQHCPQCKEIRNTTCSACGCGRCLTCDYRFCCNPVSFNYPEVTFLKNIVNITDNMLVKKLVKNAIIPTRNNPTDAGLDLYSAEEVILKSGTITKIKTGIAISLPANSVGLIWDRSGNGSKGIKVYGGVIDEEYRGELIVCLGSMNTVILPAGSKIAQLLIQPILRPEIQVVQELDNTVRGDKGFGSSDRLQSKL
jgi:dUTP pyrophosphatase